MNLFFRELKSHRKALFFWSLGMFLMVFSGMAKYAGLQESGQSVSGLMDQFPKAVKIIFGIDGFDLSTIRGYYGVLYLYIALTLTIHAILLGTELISKEERDKTTEFLFVKPVSRVKVITAKILAGVCNIVILNVVTLGTSLLAVSYYNKGASISNDIYLLTVGLLFLQLIFFFTGMAIASASNKPKKSASIATAVLLITFILPFLVNFNDAFRMLRFATPFEYFDAKQMLQTSSFDVIYVSLATALIVVLVATTYAAYRRRDLSV